MTYEENLMYESLIWICPRQSLQDAGEYNLILSQLSSCISHSEHLILRFVFGGYEACAHHYADEEGWLVWNLFVLWYGNCLASVVKGMGLCWCIGKGITSVNIMLFVGNFFVYFEVIVCFYCILFISHTSSRVLFVMVFHIFCLK